MSKLPYVPPNLPPKLQYQNLIEEVGIANRAIGELNGLISKLPNVSLLVTPILTSEALASSKIEGTQATIEEVFKQQATELAPQNTEKEGDIREIINYRRAVNLGMRQVQENPIAENLIKGMHHILLDSVRGESKERGKLRRIQVFIGMANEKNIENASYIPPPITELPRLLTNWENYVNNKSEPDPIIQIAVAHYQFEAIHPFRDGNGRMGRLLIPLMFYKAKLLDFPVLYISDYFEKGRDAYINQLRAVDQSQQWCDWVRFFLNAVSIQALRTQQTVFKMLSIYDQTKKQIQTLNSKYAIELLDLIFANPFVSFSFIRKNLGNASPQTVYNLLEKCQKEKILVEITGGKRNKQYAFSALLDCIRQQG